MHGSNPKGDPNSIDSISASEQIVLTAGMKMHSRFGART
jgi:hypothetical protein